MTFKEQLAADLADVFLCPDAFGDKVVFQGREIAAVIAKDSAEALDEWRKRTDQAPAVNVRFRTLYYAAADVERLYPEDAVTCDGVEWSVLSTAEDAGLLTVHLYRHES